MQSAGAGGTSIGSTSQSGSSGVAGIAGSAAGGDGGGGSTSLTAGSAGTAGSAVGGASGAAGGSAGSGAVGGANQSGAGGAAGASTAGAGEGGGGGAAACVTVGNELCEDFESGEIDLEQWALVKTRDDAAITVEQDQVHAGQYALHVHVAPDQQTTAQIEETLTFPGLEETLYARMFAYFVQELPSDPGGGYHMGFIQAVGHNDLGEVRSSVGSIADRQVLGDSIYFGPPFHEFGPWSETRYAAGQWYCIELFTTGVGGVNTERRIWIDDVEMDNQHTNYDGQQPPQFEHLSFGIWQYHPTPSLSDVWIDDIRVSAQKIGCSG
jgi:hypothetical protein